jgi:hypothetical protein
MPYRTSDPALTVVRYALAFPGADDDSGEAHGWQPGRLPAPVWAAPLAAWQSGHGIMQARLTCNGERQHDFAGVAAKVLHYPTRIWRRLSVLTFCLTFR